MMRSMLRRTAVPAIVVLIAVVASLAVSAPANAAGKTTLVLGIDISDTRTNDPSRQFEYSTPTTMRAVYETLITLSPGEYVTLKPLLAESWKLVDGGKAWEFKLRKGVKFVSGNPLTAADVKFSFERLQNLEAEKNLDWIKVAAASGRSAARRPTKRRAKTAKKKK